MKTLVTRLTLFVLVLCASKTVLAANIWDGGGGDALWDTAGNWDDDVVPGVAAITIGTGFGSGLTIDLNGNRTITSLAINATGLYTIANDTLTLNSGTISRTGAGGTVTIGSDVALGANGAWNNSASASSQIQVDGIISDGGSGFGVTTTASSSSRGFTFNGANTFTGDLTVNTSSVNIGGDNSARTGQNIVNSGSLIVSHADALGSGKIVMNGGSLNLGFASDVTLSNPWAITSSTFGYTGSGGGSEFTMTGTLDPLAQSISLIANAGGGSSRAIIIDSAVTQAVGPAVSITTIGGATGPIPGSTAASPLMETSMSLLAHPLKYLC